ncbi:hypothetical protein R3P38DRAFT_3035145 [Favolaschia claudopus]|uniref:Uncharacterized protein n=1 Tax=Favolaschia claudopus TaxID=2862362 RepID=A0AAW0ACA1_9AGAR
MVFPSLSSLWKFYLFRLTRSRPMSMEPSTDSSKYALLPPSTLRLTTVAGWIERLGRLPDADHYRVSTLELYKDANGMRHEWIRFTLVDCTVDDPVSLATIKTDRCSSVDGGSSVDIASSPSQLGEALDRILHARDPEGRDLLNKGPRLIMELTYDDVENAPSILDVAAALAGVHSFAPNYDALTGACFNYAIATFLLITEKFPDSDSSPVRIHGKQGYAMGVVKTARWAAVLNKLGATNHIPAEKCLPQLVSAAEKELTLIQDLREQHRLAAETLQVVSRERDEARQQHTLVTLERDQALAQLRALQHQFGLSTASS